MCEIIKKNHFDCLFDWYYGGKIKKYSFNVLVLSLFWFQFGILQPLCLVAGSQLPVAVFTVLLLLVSIVGNSFSIKRSCLKIGLLVFMFFLINLQIHGRHGVILVLFVEFVVKSFSAVVVCSQSFVDPRPDVPGYADKLSGDDRRVLLLKPGITGPATLKYANEEELLASVKEPVAYNNEVIFPDKVRINLAYLDNYSLFYDLLLIIRTVFRCKFKPFCYTDRT